MNRRKLIEIIGLTSALAGFHQYANMLRDKGILNEIKNEVSKSVEESSKNTQKISELNVKIEDYTNNREIINKVANEGAEGLNNSKSLLEKLLKDKASLTPEEESQIVENLNKASKSFSNIIDQYGNKIISDNEFIKIISNLYNDWNN